MNRTKTTLEQQPKWIIMLIAFVASTNPHRNSCARRFNECKNSLQFYHFHANYFDFVWFVIELHGANSTTFAFFGICCSALVHGVNWTLIYWQIKSIDEISEFDYFVAQRIEILMRRDILIYCVRHSIDKRIEPTKWTHLNAWILFIMVQDQGFVDYYFISAWILTRFFWICANEWRQWQKSETEWKLNLVLIQIGRNFTITMDRFTFIFIDSTDKKSEERKA